MSRHSHTGMRRSTWTGVCVGGPLHGRWITEGMPRHRTVVHPEPVSFIRDVDLTETVTIMELVYEHRRWANREGRVYGIWVCELYDPDDPAFIDLLMDVVSQAEEFRV